MFSKEYEQLLNKPDLSKYIKKENLEEEIKSLNYITTNNLDNYKTELKKELIGTFKDGSGNPIWTINRI